MSRIRSLGGGCIDPERIVPVGPDFRSQPIEHAFTWGDGVIETGPSGLYIVSFRSRRNLAAASWVVERLLSLDSAATQEAMLMPGFYHYEPDNELSPEGDGLSYCAWTGPYFAAFARTQPRHKEAMAFIRGEGRGVYRSYHVEGRKIFRDQGSEEEVVWENRDAA
ncbi:MAG TPA: hypothetical protein VGS28_04870 [Candidatus Saccharimonadales bacterium]|nr:hypothetical protein [Candidatus Saccharimonadales bacterium]